jgi:hypothetical protein
VSQLLKRSQRALEHDIAAGALRTVKLGGSTRVPRMEVERFAYGDAAYEFLRRKQPSVELRLALVCRTRRRGVCMLPPRLRPAARLPDRAGTPVQVSRPPPRRTSIQ